MKRVRARLIGLASLAMSVGLVVGGCAFGRAQPTPIYVYVTPSPAVSPSSAAAASALAAPSESAAPSVPAAASESAAPGESPSPAATAVPTPASSPTLTSPPAAAAVPASSCGGTVDNQTFWAQAAAAMKWAVYCPVLPSGWRFGAQGGSYVQTGGGTVQIFYAGPGGATLEVSEGAFCVGNAANCSPHATVAGTSAFGDLSGSLDTLSGGGFALYVNPGTATGYTVTGSGLSQGAFAAIAAAVVKVAKS